MSESETLAPRQLGPALCIEEPPLKTPLLFVSWTYRRVESREGRRREAERYRERTNSERDRDRDRDRQIEGH